ncbi:condensin-2 complex subunit D3-like [Leptopilina heterotoma]|uniref:condensin-2 complex subunit D3-like n=1 Tax=Leptopilina heterotoma TaxID=63436 RepID=UPI001CA8FE7F|nr:condensin-2 complex subunit D3-like [Leptopilina heterotoma]
MERFKIFEKFELNSLKSEWINSIWDGEFLTFVDPPPEYLSLIKSENLEQLLMTTCTIIKSWIMENSDEVQVKWQTLNSIGINVRALLAFLGYIMKSGQKIGADEDSRQCCLRACSLYLMLLAVPGSTVYQVFHPHLYHRAIESFKLVNLLAPPPKKVNKTPEFEELYENEEETVESLAHSEQVTLTKSLNCIMFDLITMMRTFYMKDKPDTLNITIQSLIDCLKLETSVNPFQTPKKIKKDATLSTLSYNAYIALQELCDPNHGAVDLTIQLVAKYFLPILLSSYTELQQKSLVIMQETIINFLKNLLISKRNEAENGILILTQQLMINCPERLEARQKQANVVAKLINITFDNLYLKIIENLILFSFHNKVMCRIFAMEIISKCIVDQNDAERGKVKRILITATLGRCIDSSSLVRGRAMAIISNCIDMDTPNRTIFKEIFDESRSENDNFPPTVNQLSSAIFTDDNPLPTMDKIYPMLMDRLEDERALVRRSALQIFRNVTNLHPDSVEEIFLIIGTRCRDPTLIVRSHAIQVLTHILLENVELTPLIDHWIHFILPQVYDIEPKVQEKVLEALESLLLKKITNYTEDVVTNSSNLPWLIISRVIKEKMRKNLSKICELWKKSDLVTSGLIGCIKSHIGTKNNLSAWALLSSLSENIQLPKMDLYFSDFNLILQYDDFCSRLKLEVLRNSWPGMTQVFLREFFDFLLKALGRFEINIALISICFDLLIGIAKKLQVEIDAKMVNLIKLCENEIEKLFGDDKEEALEAELLYVKAMSTLGHAAFLSSVKISRSTVRTLQGLLLEWQSIPRILQTRKELQATAIALLGQLSMRDREIAEETMPIFGKLMSKTIETRKESEAANKINSAKTLADLCIQYTALVESYLPDMCVSMKDENPRVREVIVVIFIQLLLEDFIKIKGPFFFHILTMLTDDDETIRELTMFLIKERLLSKNKTLVSQQFIKSIFHYNNCQAINKFAIQTMRENEKKTLTLPGRENEARRRIIYDFLLEHLDPPGKLKLICKITSEILGRICDNVLDIKLEPEICMLRDVLYLLSNEQLQVSNKQFDDDSQEETGNVANLTNAKAIHEIIDGIKRHKLEVLLPIIIKLKKKLAQIKSSLLADVTKFFLKIISEYNREQLSNIYNEYPNLDKDIEIDSRKYGKKGQNCNDDENEEEDDEQEEGGREKDKEKGEERKSGGANIERRKEKIKNLLCRNPKIVLRRLSTLTYQSAMGSKISISDNSIHSPEPGPSSRK